MACLEPALAQNTCHQDLERNKLEKAKVEYSAGQFTV